MASFEDLITGNDLSPVWLVIKLVYVFIFALYVVFAALVVRQITLMTGTLENFLNDKVRLFGYLHLVLAFGLLFLALVVL